MCTVTGMPCSLLLHKINKCNENFNKVSIVIFGLMTEKWRKMEQLSCEFIFSVINCVQSLYVHMNKIPVSWKEFTMC